MYENNKIIDFAVYDSLYEFIIDHNTFDAIKYSFCIDEKLYNHLLVFQKANDSFFRNYSLKDFVAKFGLEEILV